VSTLQHGLEPRCQYCNVCLIALLFYTKPFSRYFFCFCLRLLPCMHALCTSCCDNSDTIADSAQEHTIKCQVCSRVFNGTSSHYMHLRFNDTKKNEEAAAVPKCSNDVCEKLAEAHCSECQIYSCREHLEQIHDSPAHDENIVFLPPPTNSISVSCAKSYF